MELRADDTEWRQYRFAAVGLVRLAGGFFDDGAQHDEAGVAVGVVAARRIGQRVLETFGQQRRRRREMRQTLRGAAAPDLLHWIVLVVAGETRAMRQKLLDRRALQAPIHRRTVAAEESAERIAQRRGEGELAVADQRRDADAG